jgi:hypothetical protein
LEEDVSMGTASNAEDEADLALLHQYMRPEEELLAYRRLAPWRGEHRWFRSPNVVPLERYRADEEWARICDVFWPQRYR